MEIKNLLQINNLCHKLQHIITNFHYLFNDFSVI